MINLRLIRVLGTFSPEEWKEFTKFISSPYFNKGRNYSAFLIVLKKFSPGFNSPKLSKEYCYKKLFRGKKYKETVMNTMISGLYNLAVEFLIELDYRKKTIDRNMGLLYQLSSRNLASIHKSEFNNIEKYLRENKIPHDFFKTLQEVQTHKIQHSFKSDYEKTIKEDIPKRGDYFIFYFVTLLLPQLRDLVVMENTLNYLSEKKLVQEIFSKINFDQMLNYTSEYYPDMSRYFNTIVYCYLASLDENDEIYIKASEALTENYNNFDSLWNMNLAICLDSGCASRISRGNRKYIRERHELHRFMLKNNMQIYSDLGYMHPRLAENFIMSAVWNKEFDWLEKFLTKHKHEFGAEYKDEMTALGEAYILFNNNDYNKSLEITAKIPDRLFSLKQKVKFLQLCIYYELKEFDLAFNALDAFKHFARNNKNVTGQTRNVILENSNNYEILLKRSSGRKKLPAGFRENILNEPPQLFNDWLLEKINNK